MLIVVDTRSAAVPPHTVTYHTMLFIITPIILPPILMTSAGTKTLRHLLVQTEAPLKITRYNSN